MSLKPENHQEKRAHLEDEGRPEHALDQRIRRLVKEPVGVLCTQGEGQPYGSLVFFAFSDDLKWFVFATPRATRKYSLLKECDHVAFLLDTRMKFPEDMMNVEAVTVTGRATEIKDDQEFKRLADHLVGRHPYIESFVAAPSIALFRVDVVRYIHVSRFQEVRQWIPSR